MEILGLEGVIDRIEKYFGRKVTAVVLGSFCLSIVGYSIVFVWVNIISPFIDFSSKPENEFLQIIALLIASFALGNASIFPIAFYIKKKNRENLKMCDSLRAQAAFIHLKTLRRLRDAGKMTEDEFQEARRELLEENVIEK